MSKSPTVYKTQKRRTRTPVSRAQQWARKRNWAKAQLICMLATVYRLTNEPKLLTTVEQHELAIIARQLKAIEEHWDTRNAQSKSQYTGGVK